MATASTVAPGKDLAGVAANALTYVLNPLFIPPLVLWLAAIEWGAEPSATRWIAGSAACLYVVLPVAMLLALKRSGHVASLEVRSRQERHRPFMAGVLIMLLAIPIVSVHAGVLSAVVVSLAAAFPVNLGAIFVINLRFKISVHAASVAGLLAFLLWLSLPMRPEHGLRLLAPGAAPITDSVALALVVLVMWARVRAGAHSVYEVVAGGALGLVLSFAELMALGAAGRIPIS